jgi:hypothetical protein
MEKNERGIQRLKEGNDEEKWNKSLCTRLIFELILERFNFTFVPKLSVEEQSFKVDFNNFWCYSDEMDETDKFNMFNINNPIYDNLQISRIEFLKDLILQQFGSKYGEIENIPDDELVFKYYELNNNIIIDLDTDKNIRNTVTLNKLPRSILENKDLDLIVLFYLKCINSPDNSYTSHEFKSGMTNNVIYIFENILTNMFSQNELQNKLQRLSGGLSKELQNNHALQESEDKLQIFIDFISKSEFYIKSILPQVINTILKDLSQNKELDQNDMFYNMFINDNVEEFEKFLETEQINLKSVNTKALINSTYRCDLSLEYGMLKSGILKHCNLNLFELSLYFCSEKIINYLIKNRYNFIKIIQNTNEKTLINNPIIYLIISPFTSRAYGLFEKVNKYTRGLIGDKTEFTDAVKGYIGNNFQVFDGVHLFASEFGKYDISIGLYKSYIENNKSEYEYRYI